MLGHVARQEQRGHVGHNIPVEKGILIRRLGNPSGNRQIGEVLPLWLRRHSFYHCDQIRLLEWLGNVLRHAGLTTFFDLLGKRLGR